MSAGAATLDASPTDTKGDFMTDPTSNPPHDPSTGPAPQEGQYQTPTPPPVPVAPPAAQYQAAPPPPQGMPSYRPGVSGPDTALDQPYYGISFWPGIKRYWQKYATFTGRASRSEFWWAYLGNGIIFLVLYLALLIPGIVISGNGGSAALMVIGSILVGLFGLAVIIPTFAILWRRLHDTNLAGPFALLTLVPSLGGIWGLVTGFLPPNPVGARFDVHGG